MWIKLSAWCWNLKDRASLFMLSSHHSELELIVFSMFMAALCNRAGHYILPCGFFLSSFLFPRLISAATDWMLNNNTSSTCPDNMVNFGLLTAEICWRVWGTPANFNRFRVLAARHSSSGRQPNFAALNRGRHLYSAGRPSRWALAHILVYYSLVE